MRKSRILWGLWMLAVTAFWIASDGYSGILLLTLSWVLPMIFAILTRAAVKKVSVSIRADSSGQKNDTLDGILTVTNRSLLSMDRMVCMIRCENLLTGEVFERSLQLAVAGRQSARQAFAFQSEHCGCLRLCAVEAVAWDPFGLFRFRAPVASETKVLIRPDTFPVEVQIAYGESMSLDSDEFSMLKSGFDPSEIFAIREYRPGDRVRQIHWKLSEKMDNLMVREYGLPIQNTILILLETGKVSEEEQPDPGCMDALAEGILSLSQELTEQQIVHSLGWYNHEESVFYCVEITGWEERSAVMPALLGTGSKVEQCSVLGAYLEQHEQCEFAHVVLFTPHRISDVAAIQEQCLVTEICPVTPQTLAEDMAYIEI